MSSNLPSAGSVDNSKSSYDSYWIVIFEFLIFSIVFSYIYYSIYLCKYRMYMNSHIIIRWLQRMAPTWSCYCRSHCWTPSQAMAAKWVVAAVAGEHERADSSNKWVAGVTRNALTTHTATHTHTYTCLSWYIYVICTSFIYWSHNWSGEIHRVCDEAGVRDARGERTVLETRHQRVVHAIAINQRCRYHHWCIAHRMLLIVKRAAVISIASDLIL